MRCQIDLNCDRCTTDLCSRCNLPFCSLHSAEEEFEKCERCDRLQEIAKKIDDKEVSNYLIKKKMEEEPGKFKLFAGFIRYMAEQMDSEGRMPGEPGYQK